MALFDRANPEQFALFVKNIQTPFLQETLIENVFSKFSSSSASGLIWNMPKEKERGSGETISLGMYQYSDANEVYDDESLSGKGDVNRPISDTIRIGETRFAVATESKKLAEIQINVNLDNQLREDLHKKSKLLHTRRIINQFGFCFMSGTRGDNYHRSYSYYKANNAVTSDFENVIIPAMKACPIDQNNLDAISSDRIVIGNDALGGLQNTVALSIVNAQIGGNDPTAANAGTMTIDHIEKLVKVANAGGRRVCSEQIILPFKTAKRWDYDNNNFVLFIGPSTLSMLRKDPKWDRQVYRPFIENKGQPSMFYNTAYAGSVYGTDIIVIPEFDNFIMQNAEGSNVAYSALCGQSAIAYARGIDPMFTTENNDHTKKYELGVTMIDGMKPLKFLAKNPTKKNLNIKVERGIIHSFTRLS